MRFKPIELGAGALLVLALCGAAQPNDPPADAPVAEAPAAEAPTDVPPEPVATPAQSDNAPGVTEGAAPAEAAAEPAAVPANAAESPAVVADEPAPAPAAAPAEAAASSDQAAVPVTEIAVPAKDQPPTKEFMVGVWAEPGKSCETAIDFKADGTMIGPFPRWELSEDGELTMVGNRQKIKLIVVDKNTMQSRRAPTDPPRTLKRCPT